jgi:hypothetical protein
MAGRPCTICGHVNRWAMELRLKSQSIRVVAARFGISRSALHRHKTRHLPMAVQQPSEPVLHEDKPAQSFDSPDTVPVVSSPRLPAPEQPEPSAPARAAVAQELPSLLNNNSSRPGPCPICDSNRWRHLDGHLSCDVCHPLPPSGAFGRTGRPATPIMAGGLPSTRVPIALSGL